MNKTPNWRSTLYFIQESYIDSMLIYNEDQTKDQIENLMKDRFPGDYTLEWSYNPTICKLELNVKFEDPKKEVLWKIKYS